MTDTTFAVRKHEKLPTRAQINQINDIQALEDIKDDVERRIAKIETDLDFRDDTEEWEGRAIGALSVHRYTAKTLERRIERLSALPSESQKRVERTTCLPLTWMVMDGEFDDEDADTVSLIEASIARVQEAIESVECDRAEELAKRENVRDLVWLAQSNASLRRVRSVRHALSIKKAALLRAEKDRIRLAGESTRERLFVAACREMLPRETYLMLWNRVDRQFVEGLEPSAAA